MSALERALALASKADAAFKRGDLGAAGPLFAQSTELLEPNAGRAPKAYARGCIRLGLCARAAGRLEQAAEALETAAAFATAHDLDAHLAEATRLRAALAEQQGAIDEADAWLRRALDAYSAQGSVAGTVATLSAMGRISRAAGDLEQARDRFEQAESIAAEAGHLVGRADALANLGNLARIQADLDAAQAAFEGVLAVARSGQHPQLQALERRALTDLGNVAAARGERTEAVALYQRARQLQSDAGDVAGAAGNTCNIANIWAQQGRLPQAVAAYRDALADLRGQAPERVIIDVSLLLAQAQARLGELAESQQLLNDARDRAEAIDYAAGERRLTATLAAQDLVVGNVAAARERHAGVVAAVREDAVPADEVAVLLAAVDADLAAEAYPVARARLERAAHLVHSRELVRYRALVQLAEAHLAARGQTREQAAATLIEAAEQLDAAKLPVEALATRLGAADFMPPADAQALLDEARGLGATGAELEAQSLVAEAQRAPEGTFDDLMAQARQRGMLGLVARIARRRAAVHAPQTLEELATAAEALGAAFEARLCRQAASAP